MPRQPRIDLPGIPLHVVQRGSDRRPCFFQEIDYVRYLRDLREAAGAQYCRVHAYALMANHVHLLVTPMAAGQVGRMMQALGRRYVRYVNQRYHRTGTLWAGRYKACPVVDEPYLLRCQRYIELNPLRARMVADPIHYRWSSHAANTSPVHDALVQPHRAWLALGHDPATRRRAWRALVMEASDPAETDAIRLHLQRQHLYGPERLRSPAGAWHVHTVGQSGASHEPAGAPMPASALHADARSQACGGPSSTQASASSRRDGSKTR